MICIYCGQERRPSESHIISEALGAGPTLKSGVCKKCNNRINREIEQIAQDKFCLIRNLLNLPGKHTAVPPAIKMTAALEDLAVKVKVRPPVELDAVCLTLTDSGRGHTRAKRIAFIASTQEQIDSAVAAYKRKHPSAVLESINEKELNSRLRYRAVFDAGFLADARCLRLASKIALEWWCRCRGPDMTSGTGYTDIKTYILSGSVTARPAVSIVSDPGILGLIAAPFGIHSIMVVNDPRFRDLVVYVSLFSLVHYKVVLSRRFTSLAKTEEMYLVNPQTGYVYRPSIKRPLRVRPDLAAPHHSDLVDPLMAFKGIGPQLLRKFNSVFDRAADSDPGR